MSERSSTLAEVARRAEVSLATASRVLNGSTRGVTPELRARVIEAAEALHYVPNAHAQALARASTRMVGVIVHDVGDPYFAEISRGILRVATDAGRLVMICNTYRDTARELEYVATLRAHRVEAVVLAGSGIDDQRFSQEMAAQLGAFAEAGGRVALIGRHHFPGDAVMPDNLGGARALARALLDLGHRRIGVVTGPPLLTTTRDRLAGFRGALEEAGVELPDIQVVPSDFTREGGASAASRLLDQAPDMTAIFGMNDPVAIGILHELRRRGRRVPDDVSVAGFDDMPVAADVTPTLSTVHVPMAELGARAMTLALDRSDAGEPRAIHVPARVVLRDSTAPPPAARADAEG
jgi:LacI family transcriptional regulator